MNHFKPLIKAIFAGLALPLCAGCTHTAILPLQKDYAFVSPVPFNDVDLYTSASKVKHPYKEIAIITIENGFTIAPKGEIELMEMLIDKAKELGANGLILWDAPCIGGIARHFSQAKGLAIVYTSTDKADPVKKEVEAGHTFTLNDIKFGCTQ